MSKRKRIRMRLSGIPAYKGWAQERTHEVSWARIIKEEENWEWAVALDNQWGGSPAINHFTISGTALQCNSGPQWPYLESLTLPPIHNGLIQDWNSNPRWTYTLFPIWPIKNTDPRVLDYSPSLEFFSLVLRIDSVFLSKGNAIKREETRNRGELSGMAFLVCFPWGLVSVWDTEIV